jgi:bleomycin hydrolase
MMQFFKKNISNFLVAGLVFSILPTAFSQISQKPWEFKEFKKLAATPVKNQQQTGTCWSFSSTSFLESEVLRMGKGEVDLSEMWIVRHIYKQKCLNFMRRQGKTQFGEGGLAHDEINAIRAFGLVPESAYSGKKDILLPHNHEEMAAALENLMKMYVARGTEGKLSENWMTAIDGILDAYFGVEPTKFEVKGKSFTPNSYAENLGFDAAGLDNYVTLTSFTHHPFYSSFALEIPDNWASNTMYNLPINELMQCLNYSIQQGFTVEWDTDVSNKGFSHKNGLALVPEKNWSDMTEDETRATWAFYVKEKSVTPEYRQKLFENLTTADDHLMHITGILTDNEGGLFYTVKNSWGESNPQKGYVQVSDAYMRLNTMNFMVNKLALPSNIRKRLGIEEGQIGIEKR